MPRLPTLAIVRCCWRMWTYCGVCALNILTAIHEAGAGNVAASVMFGGFALLLSTWIVDATRRAFANLADHIKSAAADYVAANTQA